MHLAKILAFSLSFTLSIILTHSRDVVPLSFSQSATPTTATTMVMYALSTPADVPCLSRKSDRETEHLFGPVKTVTREQLNASKVFGLFTRTQSRLISSISFNAEGNKTEEINYNSGGDSIHSCRYSYDGKGRKTAQVMAQGNIHGETTYAYNHDGREVEALEQVGEKVLIKRRYVATYDAHGKQIAALYSEGDRELKASYRYSYDKQGQLTELLTAEGVVYYRVAYSYDAKGNLTGELAYRPDGQLDKKSLFSYDGDRKREQTFTFTNDGAEYLHTFELYDPRENVVEVGGFDKSGQLSGGKTIRRYEYDQAGNWIKQTVQSVDSVTGKLWGEWVEERQIYYY
jgi:YD repeat-containing protein